MLAKRVSELPETGDWIFEPKWDGYRAIFFLRNGDAIRPSFWQPVVLKANLRSSSPTRVYDTALL